MEICLVQERKLLHVLFNCAEFSEERFEGAPFRRRFGDPQGVAFTFEKTGKRRFLYISFDRYKDPEVLSRIANGQAIGEMQLLIKLAHLPRAKMFGSWAQLPNGRSVELIDTLGFELRKTWEGVWESENNETEVNRRLRQMKLNRLRDELPGVFAERPPGLLGAAGKELIFSDSLTERESGTQSSGTLPTVDESTSKQIFDPKAQPVEPSQQGEPRDDAANVSEERNLDDFAECDVCEELICERDLTEIRPGFYLCPSCLDHPFAASDLGFTPDELIGLGNKRCDGCGFILKKDDLKEAEPGRWLCLPCSSEGGFLKDLKFKRPTAEDVNNAIQLLLWRCRDAQIHKDKPEGKRGFYKLDDWITNANDPMIYELGMWCADIQELNIGTRDS